MFVMNEISLYFIYDICDEDIMVLFCDYVHVCVFEQTENYYTKELHTNIFRPILVE